MIKKKKTTIKIITTSIIFLIIGIYLLLLWIIPEFIFNGIKNMLPFFNWFFGLTLAPIIPGILYKGGKGYNKIFGSNLFQKKEKGFLYFFLDLLIGFFIVAVSIFLISIALPLIIKYVILIFIFWILLFYIWFNRYNKYKFPHYYFWTTLILIIVGGIIIYFLL